jgi:hypothetical protein
MRLRHTAALSVLLLCACDTPEKAQLRATEKHCYSLDFGTSGASYFDCLKALPVTKRSRLCTVSLGGPRKFLGTPECYETLPQKEVHGYWVRGFEQSEFHTKLDAIASRSDAGAALLELSTRAQREAEGYSQRLDPRVFEVTFIGVISTAPGLYYLDADRGVYASRFTQIADITERVFGAH